MGLGLRVQGEGKNGFGALSQGASSSTSRARLY